MDESIRPLKKRLGKKLVFSEQAFSGEAMFSAVRSFIFASMILLLGLVGLVTVSNYELGRLNSVRTFPTKRTPSRCNLNWWIPPRGTIPNR